jgi:hypothetical protein
MAMVKRLVLCKGPDASTPPELAALDGKVWEEGDPIPQGMAVLEFDNTTAPNYQDWLGSLDPERRAQVQRWVDGVE